MSEASVDLPAVGHVKKQYVYMGAALVAGIVGYAWWRNGQSSAPADIPAYTEGDVAADGIANTAGGAAGGAANSGGSSHNDTGVISTDQEWAQAANELLSGQFDSGALSIALGSYITGQTLTADQANMVRAAIGQLGYPPGGHYPIKTGGGATPSKLGEPRNLRVIAKDASSVTIAFDPVAGADYYRAYRSGASTNVGSTDAGNHFIKISGLEPNREYSFQIAADTSTAVPGPKSAPIKARTAAVKIGRPSNPKASQITRSSVLASTGKVAGATGYLWYINGVAHGHSDGPSYKVVGLKPSTNYTLSVKGDNNTQGPGPESGKTRFKTKAK